MLQPEFVNINGVLNFITGRVLGTILSGGTQAGSADASMGCLLVDV